jgi:endonuclease-8
MAEGPLVHYYAAQLRKILDGKIASIEFGVKDLKRFEPGLARIRIRTVEAYGKQFRIRLADSRVILVHLMMWGSWGIFKKGARWGRPKARARLVIRTRTHQAVAFSAPVVRLLSREEVEPGSRWGDLGPDPLRPDFSGREFFRRLFLKPERETGEALLDQTVISGVGNILRIEALFAGRIHPRRRVADLTKLERRRLLRWIRKLMKQWFDEKWLDDTARKDGWIRIYGVRKKPCPRCGGRVESFQQGGRVTFACAGCQS